MINYFLLFSISIRIVEESLSITLIVVFWEKRRKVSARIKESIIVTAKATPKALRVTLSKTIASKWEIQ